MRTRSVQLIAGLVTAVLVSIGLAVVSAGQTQNAGCASVSALRLPDVRISEAVAVPTAATGVIRAGHCRVNGDVTISRPLCPYPQKALYSGSGRTSEAQNFACRR